MFAVYLIIGLAVGTLSGWYVTRTQFSTSSQTLQTKLEVVQQQLKEAKDELALASQQTRQLGQDCARLETINQHLAGKLDTQKQEVEAMQEKLTVQFKNLANDLLEEKSRRFTDQNKVNIEGLLKPLGERIQAFEKQVVQANKESLERSVTLRTEVRKLNELNVQITQEAGNLTRAIKGDAKIQGNWGEFILESILETSGLRKHQEYSIQASFVTEEGKRYQPDVIINLPEGKRIIIDAKVSLVSYEQFFNAEQVPER
nr:DNA recombination protein RmuC [Amoebophilaceae bacterium]